MNKKGFTLIELLVTIIIIGLISYMGFPSLMKVINDTNAKKEFEYYGQTMIDAGKVYLKKEGTDLTEKHNNSNNWSEEVTLDDLITNEYINEFTPTKKGISCDKNTAGIRIKYENGSHKIDYKLTCHTTSPSKNYVKGYDNSEFIEE